MESLFKQKIDEGIFEVFSDKPQHLSLIHVHQIHSNINLEYAGEDLIKHKADGIIISKDRLKSSSSVLAIKTADCLPVLFIGEQKVAMVHAGWKGLKDLILIQPNIQDIKPHTILIGPSIGVNSFEVQEDFKSQFPQSPHFVNRENKLFFNLQAEAEDQIKKVFPGAQLIQTNTCTFTNMEYNSYRRDKTEKRNWNTYKLNS